MRLRSRSLTAVWFAVALLLASTAATQAAMAEDADRNIVQLDSARSSGIFQVKVMWLIGVSGHFGKIHGNVHVDAFRNQASVDARIDVDTIRMASPRYEAWVKSAEFFDAAKYPQIEFTSDPFPRTRLRNGGELPGTLTVRGVRQSVRFELQPSACARPAYDCPIEVAGVIHRSAFDMRSHHGTLSDTVVLQFKVFASAPAPRMDSTVLPPTA